MRNIGKFFFGDEFELEILMTFVRAMKIGDWNLRRVFVRVFSRSL